MLKNVLDFWSYNWMCQIFTLQAVFVLLKKCGIGGQYWGQKYVLHTRKCAFLLFSNEPASLEPSKEEEQRESKRSQSKTPLTPTTNIQKLRERNYIRRPNIESSRP